jgi:putative transposase
MKLGIRFHLVGVSLSDTVAIRERLVSAANEARPMEWVHRAELQPTDGADPNQVAVDEIVIQLKGDRY